MDTTALHQLHWVDVVVCIFMLLLSISIGIFYGFCHVSKNTQDYLVGGRRMPLVPVSVSLIASYISGITIMGTPAETYTYGIHYLYNSFGVIASTVVLNFIFLPVFYNLQVISVFEYLERRFDAKLRFLGTILFTFSMASWLPIVTYVSALAINQATGVNTYIISIIICVICIFYTSLGGIKAVVWTDLIQGCSMLLAVIAVVIKGTYEVGGFGLVWERNVNSTRLELPIFDPNPLIRNGIWPLVIGGCFNAMYGGGIIQTMCQRYMSLPSFKTVQKALIIYTFGLISLYAICAYTGLLMYASYHDCDPSSTGLVHKKEQILIIFVSKVMSDYPGLLGLFVAGILSATLSSLSTGLNSIAAVVMQDFYSFFSSKPLSERQSSIMMKLTTVAAGIMCVLLIFVVEHLGTVVQLAITLNTIGNGPALGIFIMGVLLPWVKVKGALVGGLTSLTCMIFFNLRVQSAIATGQLVFEEKPLTTDGCLYEFTPRNRTIITPQNTSSIYQLSYFWYTVIGTLITIIAGLLGSWMLDSLDPQETDVQLLAPCIRKFFRKTQKKQYEDVHYKLNVNQIDSSGEKC